MRTKHIWGFALNDTTYIRYMGSYFPLVKVENDYYFHGYAVGLYDHAKVQNATLWFGILGGLVQAHNMKDDILGKALYKLDPVTKRILFVKYIHTPK